MNAPLAKCQRQGVRGGGGTVKVPQILSTYLDSLWMAPYRLHKNQEPVLFSDVAIQGIPSKNLYDNIGCILVKYLWIETECTVQCFTLLWHIYGVPVPSSWKVIENTLKSW